MFGHEIHGFGATGSSLQTGSEEDVAHFYSPVVGFDGKVGGETDGVFGFVVDDGEVEPVFRCPGGEIGLERFEVGWRRVWQVPPKLLGLCSL